MKGVLYITIPIFLFGSCTNALYPEYRLAKKYLPNLPDFGMEIYNDTTVALVQSGNSPMSQKFNFSKKNKNFLVVTYVIQGGDGALLEEGDTLVYRKKELYLFNEQHKLVFRKKEIK